MERNIRLSSAGGVDVLPGAGDRGRQLRDTPTQNLTGADCPRLHREGQTATVLTYCAVDVATTARAYPLLTATAPDLDRP